VGAVIEVPKAFADLGFSGSFHITTTFADDATREAFRVKVPCLVGRDQWALVAINDDGDGVLVRRDSFAILDICLRPAASGR
jgi:hypothetical protein